MVCTERYFCEYLMYLVILIYSVGVDLLSDATCVVADGGLDIKVKGTVQPLRIL